MPTPVIAEKPAKVLKNDAGVEIPLYLTTITRKVDGVEQSTTFAATKFPEDKEQALDLAISFWGKDQVFDIVLTDYMRRSKRWSADATDDKTGQIDYEDLGRMVLEYSSRSESIPELRGRIHELATIELPAVFTRLDLTSEQKGVEAQKLSERIRKLNEDIKNKRRKTPEDEKALAEESDSV